MSKLQTIVISRANIQPNQTKIYHFEKVKDFPLNIKRKGLIFELHKLFNYLILFILNLIVKCNYYLH